MIWLWSYWFSIERNRKFDPATFQKQYDHNSNTATRERYIICKHKETEQREGTRRTGAISHPIPSGEWTSECLIPEHNCCFDGDQQWAVEGRFWQCCPEYQLSSSRQHEFQHYSGYHLIDPDRTLFNGMLTQIIPNRVNSHTVLIYDTDHPNCWR